MASALTAQALATSAEWFVYQARIDGTAEVVSMTAESYRASAFLDNRITLPSGAVSHTVRFQDLIGLAGDVSVLDTAYIFHISHVGSTLMARIAGEVPGVLALREPLLLRWLAEIRRDCRQPESPFDWNGYVARLRATLAMLGRKLPSADRVVVKATSFANNLAEDILALQPKARAIAIYCGFEEFAASLLKGSGGWHDMLAQAPTRMIRLHRTLGRQPWLLSRLSPGEIVALNWLTEIFTLKQADIKHSGRLHWINFENFLNNPDEAVPLMLQALSVDASAVAIDRINESGVLHSYSKNPKVPYGVEDRRKVQRVASQDQAVEIQKGIRWLERAISDHPEFKGIEPFVDGSIG